MRTRLLPLLAAAAILGVAPRAHAFTSPCPLDTVCTSSGCDFVTTPSHDRSASDIYGTFDATYDLKQAGPYLFQVSAGGAGDLTAGSASVNISDVYVLSGPPAGTPVTFHVSLLVTASVSLSCAGYSATADASMREAGAAVVHATVSAAACYNDGLGQPIGFDLTKNVGDPFVLGFAASADALGGESSLTGSLSFTNLAPGVQVTSCQGFVTGSTTAVARRSWGDLKLRYR